MYVTDAIVWLQQFDGHSSLERVGRLDVAPVMAPGSAPVPFEVAEADCGSLPSVLMDPCRAEQ